MIETIYLPERGDRFSDEFSTALCDLIFDMQENGYRCGAPSPEADHNDREIVNQTRCERCQHEMFYQPFMKAGSYRAFAVCTHCGNVEEF